MLKRTNRTGDRPSSSRAKEARHNPSSPMSFSSEPSTPSLDPVKAPAPSLDDPPAASSLPSKTRTQAKKEVDEYEFYAQQARQRINAQAADDLSSDARQRLDAAGVRIDKHLHLVSRSALAAGLLASMAVGDAIVVEEAARRKPACMPCWRRDHHECAMDESCTRHAEALAAAATRAAAEIEQVAEADSDAESDDDADHHGEGQHDKADRSVTADAEPAEGPSSGTEGRMQGTNTIKDRRYKASMPSTLPTWCPESTGEGTAKQYVRRFEISCASEDYDPAKWGMALLLSMRGSARKWADAWIDSHEKLAYDEIKTEFVQHYTEADETRTTWQEYFALRQRHGERAREFCVRFRELAERLHCSFDDAQTLFHFGRALTGRLAEQYETATAIEPPKDLATCFARAIHLDSHRLSEPTKHAELRRHEEKRDKRKAPRGCSRHPSITFLLANGKRNPSWHTDADCEQQRRERGAAAAMAATAAATRSPETSAAKPASSEASSSTASKPTGRTRACYNCKSTDHLLPNCPHRRTLSQHFLACHEPTELERIEPEIAACEKRVRKQGGAQTYDMFAQKLKVQAPPPASNAEPHDPQAPIMVRCFVAGVPVEAMLDTGCEISYIHENWVAEHGVPTEQTAGTISMGEEGKQVPRRGRTKELRVELSDGRSTIAKLELAKPRSTMFLGRDLMKALGIGVVNLPDPATAARRDSGPIDDAPTASVEAAVPHPEQERVKAAIEAALERNKQARGFCPLPEAEVRLELNDDTPIYLRQYKVAQVFHAGVAKQIQAWLDSGVIKQARPSNHNNPLTVSWKKDEHGNKGDPTKIRVNLDARQLNKRLKGYSFDIPIIAELFDRMAGSSVYSCIDIKDAFCTFPVRKSDRKFLSFTWDGQHYNWVGAPFGLKILSHQFQRVMRIILADMAHFSESFIDDIGVHSKSVDDHIVHLTAVIDRLTEFNFRINLEKSKFGYLSVHMLGHHLDEHGVRIDRRKLADMDSWPEPMADTIEHFIGLINYFRAFIPSYATVMAPLNAVRKQFEWGHHQKQAWQTVKKLLANAPFLAVPDFAKPFCVASDASNHGLGAVLFQHADAEQRQGEGESEQEPCSTEEPPMDLRPGARRLNFIAFASRALQKSERNYSATKKEALGLVFALTRFRNYIIGRRITAYTDHRALVWLFDQYESNRLTNSWFDTYLEHDVQVVHLPGIHNVLPDHLSRLFDDLRGSQAASPDSVRSSTAASGTYDNCTLEIEKQPTTLPDMSSHPLPAPDKLLRSAWLRLLNSTFAFQLHVELPRRGSIMPKQEWKDVNFVDCRHNMLLAGKTLNKALDEAEQRSAVTVVLLIDWPEAPWQCWVNELEVQTIGDSKLILFNRKLASRLASTPAYPRGRASRLVEPLTYERVDDQVARDAAIDKHHAMGHFGPAAMVRSITADGLYWDTIRKDCAAAAAKCVQCLRYNVRRNGFHPLTTIHAELPWDHIAIDLAQLPTTSDGHNYVAIVVDVCTRYVFLRALKTKAAAEIAVILLQLFADVGYPKILQSDNGTEFVNELVQQLLRIAKIEHRTTTAYHPRANGVAERCVRATKETLHKELEGAATEWVSKLPMVQVALNRRIHSLHGSAPFTLFFARKFNFFGDYRDALSNPLQAKELHERFEMFDRLVFPAVSERSRMTQRDRKTRFDQENMIVDFPVGAQVMSVPDIRSNKAEARFEGPYTIVGRTRGGAYQLLDSDGLLLPRHYAPSQLRLIALPLDDATVPGSFAGRVAEADRRQRDEHGEESEEAYRADEDQGGQQDRSDTFQVEAILADKIDGSGKRSYLVKWSGYSADHNTWEPASHFHDLAVIQRYWKAKANQKGSRSRPARVRARRRSKS